MGRAKLRDTATAADWRFVDDEALMDALLEQAVYGAKRWNLVLDDLWQETLLWLAVRPHLHGKGLDVLWDTRAVAQSMGKGKATIDKNEVCNATLTLQ